jgi:hypothetical protein
LGNRQINREIQKDNEKTMTDQDHIAALEETVGLAAACTVTPFWVDKERTEPMAPSFRWLMNTAPGAP